MSFENLWRYFQFGMHPSVFVIQLVLLVSSKALAQQECINYVNETDQNRSVDVDSQTTNTVLCDRNENWNNGSLWIRFPVYGKTRMPEYCTPAYACNTHATGWLNGEHPAVEDGIVQRQLCFRWRSYCCYWTYSISVRNCTSFFVYKPARLANCYTRLCVDLNPCISGRHQCDEQTSYCQITGEYSYSCWCKTGLTGPPGNCTDLNECETGLHSCDTNSSYCVNTIGSYSCHCKTGFTSNGYICEDVDECLTGDHQCSPHLANCLNNEGSYSCECDQGYTGDGINCTDVNECKDGIHDCNRELATCLNTEGSYTCQCRPGYTGDGRNCSDIDECISGDHNCHELGVCTNNVGSFTCHCQRGYTGNGTWCAACPQFSICIQTTPTSCDCWRKFFYPEKPEVDLFEDCQHALGMETGAISNGQITASSEFAWNHAAILGRLHFNATATLQGGWSARTNDVHQWFQVDLGIHYTRVRGIATQGRNAYSQWVTMYNLQYGDDGVNFQYYKDVGAIFEKTFTGNSDGNTVVYHGLNPPIAARYIRVRPVAWYGHISMRMELYGCQVPVPEVKILKDESQPDRPTTFRRDESRRFEASFSLETNVNDDIFFKWTIIKVSYPPLNISDEKELFSLYNTRELNIERNGLQLGLKLVIFELKITGISLVSRDFIFLKVTKSAVVANIRGGTAVERSIRKPLILDGTASYDPDDEERRHPFIFSWSCHQEHDSAPDLNISVGNISELINETLRDAFSNFTNSTNRLSRQNQTSNESSRLLSNLADFTGKILFQLPDTVYKFHLSPGKVILDTTKLVSNSTYYVVLNVRKGVRTAEYMQSVLFRDEELINIEIRCVVSCDPLISPSSRISLRTDLKIACDPIVQLCRRPPLNYRWKMFRNEGNDSHPQWKPQTDLGNLLATKVDSKHFVLKRIAPGFSYRVTVDVSSQDGARGWAAYQFKTSTVPSGGTCSVAKVDTLDLFGTSLNISCQGWTNENEPLMYQFYRKLEKGRFDMLYYGGLPYSVVSIVPADDEADVHFKVTILNVVGAAAKVFVQIQVDPPSLPTTENQIQNQIIYIKRLLILGQVNLAFQQTEVLLEGIKKSEGNNSEQFYKKVVQDIIVKMSNVKTKTLERLLQIADILGKATEDITKLSDNITVVVVDKLQNMAPVLLQKAKFKSDTQLFKDVSRSYLYCISNVRKFTSMSRLQEAELGANNTEKRKHSEKARARSQHLSYNLTEMITNTMISLQQPGEEYTVIRNKLESTVLGKQEVDHLSNLTIHDEDAGFDFPQLSSETVTRLFGSTSEVGLQFMWYRYNPESSVNGSNQGNSDVVNIEVKGDNGDIFQVNDLPNDIKIEIPVKQDDGNVTSHTEHFLNPGLMQYHIVEVHETHTTVKFSIWICLQAPITSYVRYGENPTEDVYDNVVVLPNEENSTVTDCQNEDSNMRTVWITAKKTGRYYIGLLMDDHEETETVKSRKRRSALSESSSQRRCVTFKPPPPTPPPPPEFIVMMPVYDPAKSVNYSVQVTTLRCAYWNVAEEKWTSDGCKVGQNSNSSLELLECLCNHLTSFGGELLVAPNTVDFAKVKQTLENLEPDDVIVLVTVCSVFLVYILVLVFARRADKKDIDKNGPLLPLKGPSDSGYQYEVSITTGGWRNSGTSANVSMILYGVESATEVISLTALGLTDRELFAKGNTDNFLISVPHSLGPLLKVQIGHDNSGNSASWFLSEISVVDIQTGKRSLFTCYRWLALERDDGSTTRVFYTDSVEGSEMEFKRKFIMLQKTGFADNHLWLSVVSKEPSNSFTRVQRASCCCCFFFLFMVTSAMFYETETANQQTITIGPFKVTPSQLIIALETVLITLPPSILITFLFRKSGPKRSAQGRSYDHTNRQKQRCLLPHFCVYIAWFLCISTAITSALFTVFYSLMWGGEKSARWLSSVMLSLTGDVFISQPIKIIFIAVLVASQCGRALRLRRSSQDINVQPLFDLSLDEIKQARKFKTNERKMFKFIKELVFLVLFFLLLMIVCYSDKNEHRYQMTQSTESGFQNFDKISNSTQFWKWMDEVFVEAIFIDDWYNGQEEHVPEYIGNKRSILVGMPRLRQLRVKKNSCKVADIFGKIIGFCHDSYSREDEDTDIWDSQTGAFNGSLLTCPENWEYSADEQFGGFDSWGRFAVYSGGGYIANLGYNKPIARRVIEDLIKNKWIDSQTRAVIVEFSFFNPSSYLLSVMSYFFEALPSGYSGAFKSYGILALNPTDTQARDTYLFFVLLFGVFLFCYLIIECIKIFQQKCSYFNSAWNWMELLQILTSSLALLFQWIKSKEVTKTLAKLKKNPFIPVSFHEALVWSEAETVALCITSVIATLRLLKCFHFNSQVIKLSSFMRSRLPTVTSFFMIFFVLSTGYAFAGTVAFGSENSMFSSFAKALTSQFLMVVGGSGLIHELEEGGFTMGRLFLVSFFLTAIIIITNMFVAILNDSYSTSSQDQGKEELEIADFIMKRILQTVFGYKPDKNGNPGRSKRTVVQDSVDELPVNSAKENEYTFENDAWRSNWILVAKRTPVMYRSRKVSFANSDTFCDNATIMNGDEDGLCSLWETKKTPTLTEIKDDIHSDISEESSSIDESERMTCDTNLEDGYDKSDAASTCSDDSLWQLNSNICQILTRRHSSIVDKDDDENLEDYDGDDDSEKEEDDVLHAAYVNNTRDATTADDDDDDNNGVGAVVEHAQCNRDVWKEILELLDDNCSEAYPHNSSVGPACLRYHNPAVVEDSD